MPRFATILLISPSTGPRSTLIMCCSLRKRNGMSKILSSGTKFVSGALEGEVMSRLPVRTCLIISTSPPSCMLGKISIFAFPPVALFQVLAHHLEAEVHRLAGVLRVGPP